jgi:hypothetical protein
MDLFTEEDNRVFGHWIYALAHEMRGWRPGALYDRHDDHLRPATKATTATEAAATGTDGSYRHTPQARTEAD